MFPGKGVRVLKIEGKCSCVRAKAAHISGHLPRGTKTAAGTRPRDIPRIAQGADIPATLRTPRTDHPAPTAPTDQETPQQIRMLGIVALRALTVPGELSLRSVPGLGINDRGHPNRNSFGLRAARTALAVAGVAIFEPAPPMGAADIPGLRTIVIGLPFIERVAQHINHTTLGPPPW